MSAVLGLSKQKWPVQILDRALRLTPLRLPDYQ